MSGPEQSAWQPADPAGGSGGYAVPPPDYGAPGAPPAGYPQSAPPAGYGQPGPPPAGQPGPPPYGYGQPPYQGYPPYAMQAPVNTYAILAAIFAFVVLPPLGIYFGHKARQQIAQTGERGSELATVGIVGGWILTSLYAVGIVLWCGFAATFLFAGVNANT
jgi:hypothetical protein